MKTLRHGPDGTISMLIAIVIASSSSPPPAELGEVGASEAKLREGVVALQVCHLTIAVLGPLPNFA